MKTLIMSASGELANITWYFVIISLLDISHAVVNSKKFRNDHEQNTEDGQDTKLNFTSIHSEVHNGYFTIYFPNTEGLSLDDLSYKESNLIWENTCSPSMTDSSNTINKGFCEQIFFEASCMAIRKDLNIQGNDDCNNFTWTLQTTENLSNITLWDVNWCKFSSSGITVLIPGCQLAAAGMKHLLLGSRFTLQLSVSRIQIALIQGSKQHCHSITLKRILHAKEEIPLTDIHMTEKNGTLLESIKSHFSYKEKGGLFVSYFNIGQFQHHFISTEDVKKMRDYDMIMSNCKGTDTDFSQYACSTKENCSWIFDDKLVHTFRNGTLEITRSTLYENEYFSLFSPVLPSTGSFCSLAFYSITDNVSIRVIAHQHNSSFMLKSEKSLLHPGENHRVIGKSKGGVFIEIVLTFLKAFSSTAIISNLRFHNCSTEFNAGHQCQDDEIMCSTGVCIAKSSACDLVKDCLSWEDERREFCENKVSRMQCDFEEQLCSFLITNNSANIPKCNFVVKQARYNLINADHTLSIGSGHYLQYDASEDVCRTVSFRTVDLKSNYTANSLETCNITVSVNLMGKTITNTIIWGIEACQGNRCSQLYQQSLKSKGNWVTESVNINSYTGSFYLRLYAKRIILNNQIAFDDIFFSPGYCVYDSYSLENNFSQINTARFSPDRFTPILVLTTVLLIGVVLSFATWYRRWLFRTKRQCCNDGTMQLSESVCDALITVPESVIEKMNDVLIETNPNYEWYTQRHLKDYIKTISPTRLRIHGLVGRGMFGEIYKGLMLRSSSDGRDTTVAIKKLQKNSSDMSKANFFLEAFTLSKFNHCNIVRCIAICMENSTLSMIQEYLEGGDLKTYLTDLKVSQSKPDISELVRLSLDIANAGQYLECHKFIHRDIAARNCLLTTKGPGKVAKIGDFGLARDMKSASCYVSSKHGFLPLRWMPPESFQDLLFSSKSDVWSFGVVLWETFSYGQHPYSDKSNTEVQHSLTMGYRMECPVNCPKRIYELMLNCWEQSPSLRPSFATLYKQLASIKKSASTEIKELM